MADFRPANKNSYILLCVICFAAMLTSCVKTPVTETSIVSGREHIFQREGDSIITRFDSRIFLTEGDELQLLNSATTGNTFFVLNTNDEISVEHKGASVKLLANDVVQVTSMNLNTWLDVVSSDNRVEVSVAEITIVCGAGTTLDIDSGEIVTIEVVEGEATASAGELVCTLQEGSITSFNDVSAIVSAHSFGTIQVNGTQVQRGQIVTMENSITEVRNATDDELALFNAAPYETLSQNFDDGDSSLWKQLSGDWKIENDQYVQKNLPLNTYRAVVDFPITNGRYRFDVVPLKKCTNYIVPFVSQGTLWKYLENGDRGMARWGAYRSSSIDVGYTSGTYSISLGYFGNEIGRRYSQEIEIFDSMVAVSIDGAVRAVLKDPVPDKSGKMGLYTEASCAFDNLFAVRYE